LSFGEISSSSELPVKQAVREINQII